MSVEQSVDGLDVGTMVGLSVGHTIGVVCPIPRYVPAKFINDPDPHVVKLLPFVRRGTRFPVACVGNEARVRIRAYA